MNKIKRKLLKAYRERMLWEFIKGKFLKFFKSKISKKLIVIKDKSILERTDIAKSRHLIEKEYAWYRRKTKRRLIENQTVPPKIIWWCWLQGEENISELSKICLSSLKKKFSDYEINIITNDNLKTYIDIPKVILKKYHAGIIASAHFSDIIRLLLLKKYGGLWVDASVFCSSNKAKEIIESSQLFMYQNGLLDGNRDIKVSNWLISCEKRNPIISDSAELLCDYWIKHSYDVNYFVTHLLMTMVIDKYKDQWNEIPAFNNVSPHLMVKELNNKFDSKRFEQLNEMSSFHKLNNHVTYEDNGTLYGYLKKQYLGSEK